MKEFSSNYFNVKQNKRQKFNCWALPVMTVSESGQTEHENWYSYMILSFLKVWFFRLCQFWDLHEKRFFLSRDRKRKTEVMKDIWSGIFNTFTYDTCINCLWNWIKYSKKKSSLINILICLNPSDENQKGRLTKWKPWNTSLLKCLSSE